ncbi:MAG: beta-ketoacyl-ACP synthase III [Alphaproteobacteria bacterium]
MDDLIHAAIVGTGMCVPDKILTNQDLEKMVDTSDEWITTRTGIKERRITDEKTATSDLAVDAARKALADASVAPEEVGLIIVASVTPDYFFPSTAALVQDRLGAKNAGGFDLESACSGFVYGVIMASDHVRCNPNVTAVVIGAETLTKITDYTDRRSCILFGDGAGAAVLQANRGGKGVLTAAYGVDGSGGEMMILRGGGSAHPASHKTVEERMHYMEVRGRQVYRFAVLKMVEMVETVAKEGGKTLDDISLIVPHQVNRRILEGAADRLGISMDKIYCNIDRYGNTSAASAAIALDEACHNGRIKPGDNIVLVAFGGGLSWSACLLKW